MFMRHLLGRWLYMRFARSQALLRAGRCDRSARAAVEAGTAHRRVVDYGLVDVGVVNHRRIHVGDCGVIREMSAAPFSARKPHTAVSESIIHAAIEAHVRSPIAGVKPIHAARKSPVSRS